MSIVSELLGLIAFFAILAGIYGLMRAVRWV